MGRPATYFLDACVLMYAVGRGDPYREPCVRIIAAAAGDLLHAVTDAEAIQEIAYRFDSLGRRGDGIRFGRRFARVVAEVLPVTCEDALRALDLMEAHPSLTPRDAIHVAVMEAASLTHAVTADRHFGQVEGVVRVDPVDLTW